MKYKLVENPSLRSTQYKDGEALSVAYRLFDEKAYERAKKWLEARNIAYTDLGFRKFAFWHEEDDYNIIVTSYNKNDSDFVFNNLDNADESRLCVVGSRWVDVL